jgi:biotin synthase-related radical SAM superfamily protein
MMQFSAEADMLAWAAKYPQHNLARLNWETSDVIARFLDWATTNGIQLCKQHSHVDGCYKAIGETVTIAKVRCGVGGQTVICGYIEDAFYPLLEEHAQVMAQYFGLDLAAYDREELELRKPEVSDGRC